VKNNSMGESMTKNSLMPHYDPRYEFPGSRDFMLEQFKCLAIKCSANVDGICVSPASAVIGEDGVCENFHLRRLKSNINVKGL